MDLRCHHRQQVHPIYGSVSHKQRAAPKGRIERPPAKSVLCAGRREAAREHTAKIGRNLPSVTGSSPSRELSQRRGLVPHQEVHDGEAQNAKSEGEENDREAHGQRCKKTPLIVREGQEEEISSGIRPIERGDDRRRSEGGQMTQRHRPDARCLVLAHRFDAAAFAAGGKAFKRRILGIGAIQRRRALWF